MKSLLSLLILTVSLFTLTVPAFAQTNTPSSLDTVKSAVATNMNQVLIEMLSGTKDAAKEIYGASKEAIHKSVDFVSEQAPDVIKQFLHWKLAESIIWLVVNLATVSILLYVSRRLWKWEQNEYNTEGIGYVGLVLGCFAAGVIFYNGVVDDVTNIVKISVAPKVYIIEYVVDTVKSYERGHNNH